MSNDRRFMWRALELARKGAPYVAPNPMVGAVVVRDGRVISEGLHEAFGAAHAEAAALDAAGAAAKGATLYVTLEPCFRGYAGKQTPPCTPHVIKSGVSRVVIATLDSHPEVRGAGAQAMRDAGIEVAVGECEDEARELNAAYFKLVETGTPLVTAKWAMTLDGKIATRTGDARWISSEESRQEVHFDRACTGAIIVGIGTVLTDDPQLTARGDAARQPLRVVVDPNLRITLDRHLIVTAGDHPVLIYASDSADAGRARELTDAGVEVVRLPAYEGRIAWRDILAELGNRRISSAIAEGGGGLLATAFQDCAVDRVKVYVAPKVFGGRDATTAVEGPGVPDVNRAVQFDALRSRVLGPDVVIEGTAVYPDDTGPSASGHWIGFGQR